MMWFVGLAVWLVGGWGCSGFILYCLSYNCYNGLRLYCIAYCQKDAIKCVLNKRRQEYLTAAGQAVVPSHKVFGRVDPSQPLPWYSHGPVAFRPVTLQQTQCMKSFLGVPEQVLELDGPSVFFFSPARLRGRPAAAPPRSRPCPRPRYRRSDSVDAWLSVWTCWWRSAERRRSQVSRRVTFSVCLFVLQWCRRPQLP